jgi:site-specific recombinase
MTHRTVQEINEELRARLNQIPHPTDRAMLRNVIKKLQRAERRQADVRLREVLKEIVDTFDESDNEVARNVVLFYAKEHSIDITPNTPQV